MLIVTGEGDRRCKLRPSRRAIVALVYLCEHTTRLPGRWPLADHGHQAQAPAELTPTEKTVNRALAAARAPVERGVACLKSWRIFRRSRCSPNRMTSIAKAILTLERQR